MRDTRLKLPAIWAGLFLQASSAWAGWNYSGPPGTPNAYIQTDKTTLELQCDRIRFAPAAFEDSQDIERKQGLSIRFMKNGSTESGAFQAGGGNAEIRVVDGYPVEIVFREKTDYDLVLDQLSRSAVLNLAAIDRDVTYGIFSLNGSAAAIESLRAACGGSPVAASVPAASPTRIAAPEGLVYCGGGGIKRRIEYVILSDPQDQWDARVTVNGETIRAMTAYSYFGRAESPRGFVVALMGEDRSRFLVFRDGTEDWLEYGDYRYSKCN
jgi:hypothetical protein